MIERLIWQPRLCSRYEFGVYLDKEFARKMITTTISAETQNKMNQLANEELKRFRVHWLNPYSFHEVSCFVKQIYIGSNGVWLATNLQARTSLVKDDKSLRCVEYNSHNVDTSREVYVLLALFDKWVEYADILREHSK